MQRLDILACADKMQGLAIEELWICKQLCRVAIEEVLLEVDHNGHQDLPSMRIFRFDKSSIA